MRITSIENAGKKHDRLSVYIDSKYCFSISKKDLDNLDLYVGKEIETESIDFIKDTLNVNSAKFNAINYLSYKLRSEKEIRVKLESDGFEKETADSAISELTSMGYINDRMYSQKYIFDRNKLRPISRRLLKYELRNKGISGALVDKVLDEYADDDATVALALVKKKFAKLDFNDEKSIKKVYSFLKNRGFNHDIIMFALSKFSGKDLE